MRILISLIIGIISCVSITAYAQNTFFYNDTVDSNQLFNESVDLGEELAVNTVDDNTSLLNELLEIFDLDSQSLQGDNKAILYIKGILNLLLGLASFIVIIWLIYGFYRMFFSSEEEGFSRARRIVKVCAIALALIGLAWLITTFFFSVFETITQ